MTLLEQLRLDAGLTRDALAQATGVPERTIRELESGNVRKPRLETVAPLAKELSVAVSELVTDFVSAHDLKAAA